MMMRRPRSIFLKNIFLTFWQPLIAPRYLDSGEASSGGPRLRLRN
jgi:hypothetical protein